MNHWLRDRFPSAADVQWSVRDGAGAAVTQSLDATGLEPIDLVLMSGDRLGDQSSELERFLIRQFRARHNVPDDRVTVVVPTAGPAGAEIVLFDFAASTSGKHSLSGIQPLIARLRRLVTRARAADARDFWRNADMPLLDANDPGGLASDAYADLTNRLDNASSALTTAIAAVKADLLVLAPLRRVREDKPETVSDPAWGAALQNLRDALFTILPFGVPEALPADGITISLVLIDTLLRQGQAVAALIDQRLAQAAPLRATTFPDPLPAAEPARSREQGRRNEVLRQNYVATARALFGPAFVIVPLFRLAAVQASELAQALASPVNSDALAAEEWLHSASRVRPRLAELTWSMAAGRWQGQPVTDPATMQLPHLPGTPWIGGKTGTALPRGEWLSLTVFGSSFAAKPLQAALMLDDWTETIPVDRETTGLSFNFNRPNAVAPHAVLVAVPPVLRGNWDWEDLIGSVLEGLNLARVRAVEIDHLLDRAPAEGSPHGDYFQSLPAILSEFTEQQFAHLNYAVRLVK